MVILAMILFVLVAAAMALIAVQNPGTDIHLQFGRWQLPGVPLGLLLLLAFILGACMFYLISVATAWQDSREIRALHRHVTELEHALTSANHTASQHFAQQTPGPGGAPAIPIPGLPPPIASSPPDISDMPTMH